MPRTLVRADETRPRSFGRLAPAARVTVLPEPFGVWLLQQGGLDPIAYRAVAVQRRIPACLRHLRVSSGHAARELLERRPELVPAALDVLLIGVTEFFRDPAVFEHLRRVSIPELLAGRGRLRALSAGASDGHELASLALLLADARMLGRCELLGVDCRPEAIRRARRGVYSRSSVSRLNASWLAEYFAPAGHDFCLRPGVARHLTWDVQDLFGFRSAVKWDLVLFRNVAIYLDPCSALSLWRNLAAQLSVGGVLVTGKAERPPEQLRMTRIAPCVYRKEGEVS